MIDASQSVYEPLRLNWNKTLGEIVQVERDNDYGEEMQERDRLYSLMLMKLVSHYWNGNKRGDRGNYPGRTSQLCPGHTELYAGGNYLGHNIACLAVDGEGDIIDFDFNHNELFNSSVEHAESRLVRRLFSLSQVQDGWHLQDFDVTAVIDRESNYSNVLNNVTIYTSLESCAQCAGIMALGKVKRIVYLQADPGQFLVGNLLFNLAKGPRPLSGAEVGLDRYFSGLNSGYARFCEEVKTTPFFCQQVGQTTILDPKPSITSFLCTDAAKEIFDEAAAEFSGGITLRFPEFRPNLRPNTKTNEQVLGHCKSFLDYAAGNGRRGTPHH